MSALSQAFQYFRTGMGITGSEGLTRIADEEAIPTVEQRSLLVRGLAEQRTYQGAHSFAAGGTTEIDIDPRLATGPSVCFLGPQIVNTGNPLFNVPVGHDYAVVAIGLDIDTATTMDLLMQMHYNTGVIDSLMSIFRLDARTNGGFVAINDDSPMTLVRPWMVRHDDPGRLEVRLNAGALSVVQFTFVVLSAPPGVLQQIP